MTYLSKKELNGYGKISKSYSTILSTVLLLKIAKFFNKYAKMATK